MFTKANRSTVLTLTLSSLLGFGAIIGAGAAHAAQPPLITVSHADLDLSRPDDVDTLYGRLRLAALESAVRRMHSPEMLALHRAQSGPAHAHG